MSDLKHIVNNSLFSGLNITTHAKIEQLEEHPRWNAAAKALCGYVGSDLVSYRDHKTKPAFSWLPERVDCPDCKAHKNWAVWEISRTDV